LIFLLYLSAKDNAIMTRQANINIVDAIKHTAQQIVPQGSQVILYGSRARGDARDDSDWDVLILLDKDNIRPHDYDEYTYPLRELGWDIGECINTVLYTKKDWQHDIAAPFQQNVTREGIALC
jgi:predicted nucleotidyltransferase